jgi:hypothetical protein
MDLKNIDLKKTYDNLSNQGKFACLVGIVSILNVLVTLIIFKVNPLSFKALMPILVVTLVIAPVQIYNSNCLVKGNCNKFAWYVVITAFVIQILHFLALVGSGTLAHIIHKQSMKFN